MFLLPTTMILPVKEEGLSLSSLPFSSGSPAGASIGLRPRLRLFEWKLSSIVDLTYRIPTIENVFAEFPSTKLIFTLSEMLAIQVILLP